MHRLQKHILHQLILNPEQRYADLKPAEVEGNLFMYHLRVLMNEGLVEKCANGHYQLSATGKVYVDRLSLKSFAPRIQPRIVTLMAVRNNAGEWLMYKRKRQPLINMIGFPYGKIHLGETILQAAHRELTEKTGIEAELTHVGDGYAITYEHDQPISQIMFHLFSGSATGGDLLGPSKFGSPKWLSEEAMADRTLIPNVPELLQLVKAFDGSRFFTELNHRI